MTGATKACSACGFPKSLLEFHRHADSKDGRRSQCKICRREAVNAQSARDRVVIRARKRERRDRLPERSIRDGMIQRCENEKNPSYEDYGRRGIAVCQGWRESFDAFYADMGPRPSRRHTIDRIDSNGGYDCGKCADCRARGVTKTNCRWATRAEQNRNTRQNILLTHAGETLCVAEWARRLDIPKWVLQDRLNSGWSHSATLTTPVRALRKKLEIDGDAKHVTDWSRETGVPVSAIHARLRMGWAPWRAVSQPVRGSRS